MTEQTRRSISPGMEEILRDPIKVLGKGFIRVVDYMGNDSAICQSARVSYGKGTKTVNEDRGLIRYLMSHWHSTPFEMCEIKLHVKLPVFVARQWIRHRTANVNEYSARYSILDREFYFPNPEDLGVQSTSNKQGREGPLSETQQILGILENSANEAYDDYEKMLEMGLSRELARMNLPTNIYTQWYWKVDLHNLFHFLRLRADSHAQFEIREYADAICKIVEQWVPHAYEAFEDYRLNASQFSVHEMDMLKNMTNTDNTPKHPDSISAREWEEFLAKIS